MLLNLVWTHCNIVAEIATGILDSGVIPNLEEVPRDLLTQACLLYDIGVYACGGFEHMPGQPPTDKPYIQHTIVGAWILKEEGYLPEVVEAAHIHSGVGLTSQDIVNFGLQLPVQDYLPQTTLQRLVTYSSKFHSKTPKFRTIEELTAALQRYGEDKVERFLQLQSEFGIPDLEPLKEKYKEWHLAFTFQMGQMNQKAGIGLTLSPTGISK
jgi:uncharacterized protein